MHIAILEDDPVQRELLVLLVQQGRHSCKSFDTAAGFQAGVTGETFDMALIDWMLPDANGGEVLQWVRKTLGWQLPCIVITAREEEPVVVAALEAGADDYIVKPFSARELVARIKAVMRRSQPEDEQGSIELGDLRIDGAAHRVFAAGKPIQIGPTEYRLLHFFMSHPERVYSRGQLLDHVWGGNVYVEERTVDVHIRRLRKTLEPFGKENLVQTVRGAGYRFSAIA